MRNLTAQYVVAAMLAYDAIRSGELSWLRLVDPEAGRLDDVLIGRSGRVDAYQIKWSEYRQSVTFNNLVTPSTVSGKPYPAPFRLMADGWKSLRSSFPDASVHAHYLMHDAPSSTDGSGDNMLGNQPGHLQSFLRNAFPSRASWFTPDNSVHATWSSKIGRIRDATGLSGVELEEFLTDCELDLGFDMGPAGWEPRAWADVQDLAHFLMRTVSESSGGAVALLFDDILAGLDWRDRYDLRFKHDFPVDERLYRPIEPTVQALDHAFASFDRGYIALIGPPGSGKSTTLTHILRYRKGIRLVRYYAFVRDDPQLGRGEAFAFLHDLSVQLEGMGFGRTGRRDPHPDTLHGLRDRLTSLLRELGEEAASSGGRTIILVDGLDHIDREQDPTRSLVEELPAPTSLPKGVLIVLGTQPVGLKGSTPALRPINAQLDEPGRKLTMEPLSRSNIHEIAQAALPPTRLRSGDEDAIVRASAGHPLSLAYLIKRLANAVDDEAAHAILDAKPDFGGDTTAEYGAYWDSLAGDPEVRDLLALIARIRGAVEIETIKQLGSREAVSRFASTAEHLFRQLTPVRWSFFHNSFRQFVLLKTQVDPFGIMDSGASAMLHSRLADIAAQPTSPRELRWQELYHLEQAAELTVLLERAQQRLFRDQFLRGRRISEISEDIQRALQAAAEVNDGVAVCRLLLIEKELEDRHDVLSQTDFTPTALELAEPNDLAGLLLMSDELLVPVDLAFRWSARLSRTRSDGLGLKLFEAAEPMDILTGVKRASHIHDQGLDDWAQVAWRFRPVDRLVAAIGNVRGEARQGRDVGEIDDPRADDAARLELLTQLGIGMQDAQDDAAYKELDALLSASKVGQRAMLRLAFRSARLFVDGIRTIGDPVAALTQVLGAAPPDRLPKKEAATFADILMQIPSLSHRAEDYLAQCVSPLTVTELRDAGEHAFDPTEPLFRQARAWAARGRSLDPTSIPLPDKNWDEGLVLFQRLIIVVATLWGEAIAGRRTSPEAFVRRVGPVISFRRRDSRQTFDWHHWHVITDALTILHQRLLAAAEAHGRAVFDAVLSAFETEWIRDVPPGYLRWPLPSRRRIVMSAYRIDRDAARTVRHLNEIEASIDGSWELGERLGELCELAKDWTEVGEPSRARIALDAALADSFGIYHDKDHQIENWSEWVVRLARSEADPKLVERAASIVLRLLPHLTDMHRGRGASDATSELVGALADRWPASALKVAGWLLDEGSANRSATISALLGAELRSGDDTRVAHGLVAAARLLLPFASYETAFGNALGGLVRGTPPSNPAVIRGIEIVRGVAESSAISGQAYLDILRGDPAPKEDDRREPDPAAPERVAPSLKLASGAILSQDEVNTLAQDPQEFARVLSESPSAQELDWSMIVRELFANGSNSSVREAAGHVLRQSLTAPVIEEFVQLATRVGEVELADAAIDRLVENGRPYGWMRYYDGGSRYAVSRSLRVAHPADGRARSLKLFVADYAGHGLVARELVGYMGELLTEFLDALPLPKLWEEIEEHVTMLADWKSSSYRPMQLDLGLHVQECDVGVGLLSREIDQWPGSVAWAARRGLLDVIDLDDQSGTAQAAVRQAIQGGYRQRTAGLATLECLSFRRPDVAALFVDDLKEMAWDRSSVTRFAVQNILEQLGVERPPPPQRTALPAFYQLQLPEASKPKISLTGDKSAPGEPLPDTEDPFDLTRMFHEVLKTIAAEADLPFEDLARRMAMLMRVVAPPDTWSADVERRVSGHNESIGLKLTYRRPRSLVSQHAFGMLVSELCDAQVVEWVPPYAREMLLVADPPGNLVDPQPKPSWLDIPDSEELGKYPTNDWMAAAADALPAGTVATDGQVVLGELTRIVRYGNDRVEEHRLSVVGHRELPFRDGHEPDVHELWHQERYLARDYPMLWRLNQSLPITVIAGGSLLSDVRFLALNPHLGLHLGWTFAADGLFRWEDSSGAIMAESVRWTLGNVEAHEAGGYKDRAADGWLVLASPKGWQVLRPMLAHFVRHRVAARMTGYKRSGERDLNAVRDNLPI